ncbi:DNA repair protein RadC [Patescibacteria group bacterium]|nr:DNA repair protein RadC [Patescibacteria group bacterium]
MDTYTILDTHQLLTDSPFSSSSSPAVYKLRDLPQEKKPREKLLSQGPGGLSNAELLAILLVQGTIKEDVLTMSKRVLREYGERSLLGAINPEAMSKELSIPLVKALQIAACAELGKRFFKETNAGTTIINGPQDVFNHLHDMRGLAKEQLRGLYLNSHHRVIHDEVISIGTIDANLVHPREVFRPALEYSAVAIVLAHNHPSGNMSPSLADIEFTKQLVESGKIMGIALLDHVIITKEGFSSVPVNYS